MPGVELDNDADWLQQQLAAYASVAVDQLLHEGPAACDDYLSSVGYQSKLDRLHELQATR